MIARVKFNVEHFPDVLDRLRIDEPTAEQASDRFRPRATRRLGKHEKKEKNTRRKEKEKSGGDGERAKKEKYRESRINVFRRRR